MLFRTKQILGISIIIAICILCNACEKDQPDCTGNCVSIRISGRVYDKTTGVGFKDVPVEVKWLKPCIGCTTYKVAEGNTKSDGSFEFTKTIDSGFFKNYALAVRIPTDTNYLSIPGSGGINNLEERFYTLDVNALQQVRFEYFPKTFLKIRLHRSQNDVFSYYNLGVLFTDNFSVGYYTVAGQQNARDTTLIFKTAANVYTKVLSGKIVNSIQVNSRTDSVICTQTGTNILDVNY